MSNMRHGSPAALAPGPVVRSLAMDYDTGSALRVHSHDWGQPVYASAGVMTVMSAQGTWVVPPQQAIWIPAGTPHSIEMSGSVSMRTLYFRADLVVGLPLACCVGQVPPLLREPILHVVLPGSLDPAQPEHARLVAFLLDQLHELPTMPLELPMPKDPRAMRVADRLCADPGDRTPLDRLATTSGAAKRTIERLFREETGLTFGRWQLKKGTETGQG